MYLKHSALNIYWTENSVHIAVEKNKTHFMSLIFSPKVFWFLRQLHKRDTVCSFPNLYIKKSTIYRVLRIKTFNKIMVYGSLDPPGGNPDWPIKCKTRPILLTLFYYIIFSITSSYVLAVDIEWDRSLCSVSPPPLPYLSGQHTK
jgi:hypothetical protein